MGTLKSALLAGLLEAPCPACGYHFEFQLLDAVTQVHRWCPCCRARIHLKDDSGSASGSVESAHAAFSDLERQIKRMFK